MENIYYVMHPTLGVTAVVHAPSTEKARTTFLDWLERNNHIRRADRHSFRRNMVAERLDDANVSSDVVLHYGYQEGPTFRGDLVDPSRLKVVSEEEVEFDPETMGSLLTSLKEYREEPQVHDIPVGFEEPEVGGEKDLRQEKQREDLKAMKEAGRRMPVQEVMLRGYVE